MLWPSAWISAAGGGRNDEGSSGFSSVSSGNSEGQGQPHPPTHQKHSTVTWKWVWQMALGEATLKAC